MDIGIHIDYDDDFISEASFKRLLGLDPDSQIVSVTFNNVTKEIMICSRRSDDQR